MRRRLKGRHIINGKFERTTAINSELKRYVNIFTGQSLTSAV